MSKLVDQSLGKPIQGVSQQAASLQSKGFCKTQDNFIPDPVTGLRRRPKSTLLREISQYSIYEEFTDSEGDKLLCVGNSEVKVYNHKTDTLTAVTITDSTAYDYLMANIVTSTHRPSTFLEDTLYIANPTVTAIEDTGATFPTRLEDMGVVYCLGGQYDREYKITVTYDDTTTDTASFTTPDGTTAGDTAKVQTTYIMNQLYTALPTTDLDKSLHIDNMLISIKGASSKTIVDITVQDDEGGLNLKVAFNSVKAIEDLPEFAPVGLVIKVEGISSGTEDDSYFEFGSSIGSAIGTGTFGEPGSWVEAVKIGDEFAFDTTTMPVSLIDTGSGWSLELTPWKGREIGDVESNETPSIVGGKILDLESFQGRLGILGRSSQLFSRTDRPTELWRQTIYGGILDDDAIDGSNDTDTGNNTYFVKNAQDLAVFTDAGQYVILGDTAITPTNIKLSLTTRGDSQPGVPPVGVAGSVYYVTDNGDYMGLSEYFKEDISYFALPVSDHVPRYIPGTALLTKGSNPQRMVAIQSDDNPKKLYCYKFLFKGKNKVQSAWFTLTFNSDIKHFYFTSNSMVIITDDSSTHAIEQVDFDSVITSGLAFDIHLERMKEYTLDGDSNITPDTIHTATGVMFVGITTEGAGLEIEHSDIGGGKFNFPDGLPGDVVVAGYRYTSRYTPTEPRVFDREGEVIQTGVFNIKNLRVNVDSSGAFDWLITSIFGTTMSGTISNRILDNVTNLIDAEPMLTQAWNIPWRGKSTDKECEISCDRHTPLNISYIEALGDLRKTRTRI